MFVRQDAVVYLLKAFKCEVAMKLDHGASGGYRVGVIDLNFVVALRIERQSRNSDQYSELEAFPYSRYHRRSPCAFSRRRLVHAAKSGRDRDHATVFNWAPSRLSRLSRASVIHM